MKLYDLDLRQGYIGTSQEREALTEKLAGRTCYETDTGNEYIHDGSTWQEYKMRYKDLGLVIDAVNVAAGATVSMPSYIENCKWVRSIRAKVRCEQTSNLVIYTKDSLGNEDSATSASIPTTGSFWFPAVYQNGLAVTHTGLGSKSLRFGVKNAGASPSTVVKLAIQIFGE